MLEVSALSKYFGNVMALNNAALSLMPGEIRALLGSNGSGKSTMSKILGGLVYSNNGVITIDGKKIEINSPADSRRYGISLAYQDLSLIPQFTVEENISLGREAKGSSFKNIDRKKIREETVGLIDRLNMKVRPDTLVEVLDQSTKSLVEVAKALVWNPKILILDEVTACMHHDQVKCLFGLLRELKKEGLSILIITHRFDEVFEICDTATILRNGETVVEAEINRVTENDLVFFMTGKRPDSNTKQINAFKDEAVCVEEILSVSDVHINSKVKGLSLVVCKGEIVGLCGLQGQGQAEFLRAVFGAIPYASGTITYFGENVSFGSPKEAIKKGMGFISGDRQTEGIFPDRSVTENMLISKTASGRLAKYINGRAYAKIASEVVEQLKVVAGSLNHPAGSLSGGNQQKLLFGRSLLNDLKLLLLDDPTKGVDISSRHEIHQILRKMTESGSSIIISSSDHEELLELCDRIVVFYEGKVTAEFIVDENIEEKLVSAMLGVDSSHEGCDDA